MSQPATGALDAPYWRALAEGGLVMQQCAACSTWLWPAVSRCGECGAWDPPWREVAMQGEIFSWATTHHRFGGTENLGLPYTTVLVALPQAGDRRLLGLWDGDPATLTAGMKVAASVGATTVRDKPVPVFHWRPAA